MARAQAPFLRIQHDAQTAQTDRGETTRMFMLGLKLRTRFQLSMGLFFAVELLPQILASFS